MTINKMQTQITDCSEQSLLFAAQLINKGEIVAFPTETVYGLGADAFNACALSKIFEAKGRPQDNPLIVHIANVCDIERIAEVTPDARRLIDAFMPAPLTLVLKKNKCLPSIVSAGLDTVGVRMPLNSVARHLIELAKTPIAAPSANTSTRPSPTSARHVAEDLGGKIPLIIDGGQCEIGLESTVLSLYGEPRILRPGAITQKMIEGVLKRAVIDGAAGGEPIRSPGVKYRHYTPSCAVYFCQNSASEVNQLYDSLDGKRAVLCLDKNRVSYEPRIVVSLGENNDIAAQRLYLLLRQLENDFDSLIVEPIDSSGLGTALINRLKKAAQNLKD